MTARRYLRAADIARLMGVSVRTVRRWIVSRTLPSAKVGGARLVDKDAVQKMFSEVADIYGNDHHEFQ